VSSIWVTVHGHRKKEINDAIKEQVDKISHSTLLGLTHPPAAILAEKLVKMIQKSLGSRSVRAKGRPPLHFLAFSIPITVQLL